MRGEWLHRTWIFLSISTYRTGKNSKISKVVSRQAFDRQTPDGNEGFVIEIQYLERAFCTNIYLIDKVTGSLFVVHDDHIESTGLCGSECVFDLQELEFNICELADRRNGEDDSVAVERRVHTDPTNTKPLTLHLLQDHRQFQTIFLCMKIGKILHTKVNHSLSRIGSKYTKPVVRIITTLIDCFSALNRHTSSHPEAEVGVSPGENTSFLILLLAYPTY